MVSVEIMLDNLNLLQGGFEGETGSGHPFSWIGPPHQPKGPPLVLICDIHFSPTNSKIFLKVPLMPIYATFEGERAPKKN